MSVVTTVLISIDYEPDNVTARLLAPVDLGCAHPQAFRELTFTVWTLGSPIPDPYAS